MRIRFDDLLAATRGRLAGPAVSPAAIVSGAQIDSRKIRPGDAFFAIQGKVYDGHDFVLDAFGSGAAAAVVSREIDDSPGPLIVTAEVAAALSATASWVRDALDPVVVGITGSNGKTTVKDLLASITAGRLRTVAAEGSFNNELGVPLTLLRSAVETEVVICEMGTRGPGQIAALCKLARPQVGVVVNVGVTHFEKFGSKEAIAAAKAELVAALPPGGTAVLNADDEFVASMAAGTRAHVVTFGRSETADVRATQVNFDSRGRASFVVSQGRSRSNVRLPLAGMHQVSNALAAAAAGLALGLSLEDCRDGLERARASAWRMEVAEKSGVIFVNDAYNASPASMASALQTCSAMVPHSGRLIAVLGHMAELGEISRTEHLRIGALAAGLARRLVTVGSEAAPVAEGARNAGMEDVREASGSRQAVENLGALRPGDVVLVKGSRVAGLENVAAAALAKLETPA